MLQAGSEYRPCEAGPQADRVPILTIGYRYIRKYDRRDARPGQGKRGGYRTIIAYRRGRRAVFLYGAGAAVRHSHFHRRRRAAIHLRGAHADPLPVAAVLGGVGDEA